jgi:hypothetical protein
MLRVAVDMLMLDSRYLKQRLAESAVSALRACYFSTLRTSVPWSTAESAVGQAEGDSETSPESVAKNSSEAGETSAILELRA